MNKQLLSAAGLLRLLAFLFAFPAHAAVYNFNFADSGVIPQGGTTFAVEHTISGINTPITSVELFLTFNDNSSLLGNSGGINGRLNLGIDGSSPSFNFFPTGTPGSGQQRTYDVTFLDFNGLNPNNTWALVLGDSSSTGIENGLVSWSLTITAVPEPVTVALGCFGALAAGISLFKWHRRIQVQGHRCFGASVKR